MCFDIFLCMDKIVPNTDENSHGRFIDSDLSTTNLSEMDGDRFLSWVTNVSKKTVFLAKGHKIAEEECFCERCKDCIYLRK